MTTVTSREAALMDIERSLARCNQAVTALLAAGSLLVVFLVAMSSSISATFSWGLFIIIPVLAAVFALFSRRNRLRLLLKIKSEWGVPLIPKERDLAAAAMLYRADSEKASGRDFLDDQTWKDLAMDRLYERLDRTCSDPGESVLYRMLREPLDKPETLASRDTVIRFFSENTASREAVQQHLCSLGHQASRNDVFTPLWNTGYPRTRIRLLLGALSLAALASIVLPLALWSPVLLSVTAGMFIVNLIVHYSLKHRRDIDCRSFPYLLRLVRTARSLASVPGDGISGYTTRLDALYRETKSILGKARFLFVSEQYAPDPASGLLLEYLNIFFLVETRAFFASIREIDRVRSRLRELYLLTGELDALQSVASYRASLPEYAMPVFTENNRSFDMVNACQPLLENPVPTSLSPNRNVVIITGSNMGGKSTLLRNIGANAVLAQTIATVRASSYRAPCFRIITSISRTDDIITGKSFYFVEAERILEAISSLDDARTTLCLIDELLSGTNSTERLAAAEGIIAHLTRKNVVAVIATHDLELLERLQDTCDFYHFTDNVDENGLKFDYQLRPGIATTRNAIALLKYLGYPEDITGNWRRE